MSTMVGARIQGSGRKVTYRGGFTELPEGVTYETTGDFELQCGIRVGRKEGTVWQEVGNVLLDIRNIEISYQNADGIYVIRNCDVTILGRNVGEEVCAGQVIDKFGHWLTGPPLNGAIGAKGQVGIDTTKNPNWWIPDEVNWYPGIHHCGRQGIATDFQNDNLVIDGVSIWKIARSCIDLEIAGGQTLENCTINGTECGSHHLGWITFATDGVINNLTITNNKTYAPSGLQFKGNSTCSNWLIENNFWSIKTGGSALGDPPINITRPVNGLIIRNNKGLVQFPMSVNQAMNLNDASTGVLIDPAEFTQFPEGWKQLFPPKIVAPANVRTPTITQP
jgi:hypothetical protein